MATMGSKAYMDPKKRLAAAKMSKARARAGQPTKAAKKLIKEGAVQSSRKRALNPDTQGGNAGLSDSGTRLLNARLVSDHEAQLGVTRAMMTPQERAKAQRAYDARYGSQSRGQKKKRAMQAGR